MGQKTNFTETLIKHDNTITSGFHIINSLFPLSFFLSPIKKVTKNTVPNKVIYANI